MSARFEPITGRYMQLDLFGRPHRIYVEEAGEGRPLLCLHTAGSDGRQYRALMNDARVTSKHRVIAFDMPWHGKSSPPAGWHDEEYQLTSVQYTTMILEIMTALELDKPIVVGCSIGGRIALHLALEHPERFRGIIGLQAGAHVDPYYDLNFLHRPDVHGGEVAAAIVSGLVTVTGLTNTLNFYYAILATGQSLFQQYLGEEGIPASAANTAIVINFPAITGGGNTAISVWGYQL